MFCPNCGSNIPDNSAFCGVCGTAFAQAQAPAYAAAPAYAPASAYAPAQPGLSAKLRGLSKKQFLETEASESVKTASKVVMVLFLVVAVLVTAATITVNNISFVDLPIMKMVLPDDARDELDDAMDEAADALDYADDFLDEVEDEYGSKALRKAKKMVNSLEDMTRKPSLANTIKLMDSVQALEKSVDDEIDGALDLDDFVSEMDMAVGILKTVRGVTYAFALFVVVLSLLAAIKKITALPIVCIFLYVPSCALLSSALLAVLLLVVFIALAVFISKVNKAWSTPVY